jgi:hypothetical protein
MFESKKQDTARACHSGLLTKLALAVLVFLHLSDSIGRSEKGWG